MLLCFKFNDKNFFFFSEKGIFQIIMIINLCLIYIYKKNINFI